jgi:Na+-transporting NADH:ubiquinone oxidoreductase subunit NqrA
MEKKKKNSQCTLQVSWRLVVLSSRGDKNTNKQRHNLDKLHLHHLHQKKSHLTPSGIYTRGADIE